MTVLHQNYDQDSHFGERFSFPQRQTGNQTVGIVNGVGDAVRTIARGDNVFIRKGHASDWNVDEQHCSPIPDGIDLKSACWCGMGKIAFRAAQVAPFRSTRSLLVIGAGPVGQAVIRWAKAAGINQIVVSDLFQRRLDLAGVGIHGVAGSLADNVDSINCLTGGYGFEVVVDTTGNPTVFATALSMAGLFGKLILLGDTGFPKRQHLTSDMMRKGVSVVATHESLDRDGWTEKKIDALFFDNLESGVMEFDHLITHKFAPADCVEAYDFISQNRSDAVGVLFDWT